MPEALLRLDGVFKEYRSGVEVEVVFRALDDVSMQIDAGEFVALVGPSGSGKSTLLNVVGLLDRPTRGTVTLAGQDTSHLDDEAWSRFRGDTIGFIFQFHHLLHAFSARENVLLPAYAKRGVVDEAMRVRALELLTRVGLGDRADTRTVNLSGGQQQRVAIARSLMLNPKLVLADEPTGNLDTASADQIFDLLREFNREQQTTVIVVTHDPRLAARCDRTIEIVDGKLTGQRHDGSRA